MNTCVRLATSLVIAGIFTLGYTDAVAQFTPVPFLPKECQSAATNSMTQKEPTARLVALGTFKYDFNGSSTGLDMTTGKALVWGYVFYIPERDTMALVPNIRVLGNCADPSAFIPELAEFEIPTEDIGHETLPGGYLQGTMLTANIQANAEYVKYHAAYPDSTPNAAMLTTLLEEQDGYPAGTPFWAVTWAQSIPGQTPAVPGLTCIVHGTSGETMCMSGEITSVATESAMAGFRISPNPAGSVAMLSLPESATGTSCTVRAVSTIGQSYVLWSTNGIGNVIPLDVSQLPIGTYALRVEWKASSITIPMCISR